MADVVLYEVVDRIATITLNRPEALNGLDPPLLEGIDEAVQAAVNDAGVRAVLVTGAGKAFCAGADVKAMREAAEQGPEAVGKLILHFTDHLHRTITRIKRAPKFFVAAINGAVAGGGIGLSLACDVRIAGTDAKFVAGYDRLSISPDGGSTLLFPYLAGGGRALDLLVAGHRFEAQEALKFGLVSEVVPADQLQERARAVAHDLARLAKGYAKNAKELLYPPGLEARLEEEQKRTVESVQTKDFAEGVMAFLEKRAPKFG